VAVEPRAEGYSICEKRPVGIMLEVPAAALAADHTAKEVASFSSGIRLGTAPAVAAEILRLKTARDGVERIETVVRVVFAERHNRSSDPR
jgi:phosphoenolpyruvate synthase/pyruvate phosphate dikinase